MGAFAQVASELERVLLPLLAGAVRYGGALEDLLLFVGWLQVDQLEGLLLLGLEFVSLHEADWVGADWLSLAGIDSRYVIMNYYLINCQTIYQLKATKNISINKKQFKIFGIFLRGRG